MTRSLPIQKSFNLKVLKRYGLEREYGYHDGNYTNDFVTMSRRELMGSAFTTGLFFSLCTSAVANADDDGLEDIGIGDGKWTMSNSVKGGTSRISNSFVPASFATYTTRILINYDAGTRKWWDGRLNKYSLLPKNEQAVKLGQSFGCFSRSVQLAIDAFLRGSATVEEGYANLFKLFIEKYGTTQEARRQIGLLFAILPNPYQPSELSMCAISRDTVNLLTNASNELPNMMDNMKALLPGEFQCFYNKSEKAFSINPPISLYEIGIDDEFGQTGTATFAGPIGSKSLERELPNFSMDIYALFGISGGTGCAITHSVVIPLDVVKTRKQTDPEMASGSLMQTASEIVKNEGPAGLLLGAQATVVGYLWYGCSVYPSYAFFKKLISQAVLSPEVAIAHGNDIALLAGALAAIVASLGLTPLEAARIRTVADPSVYRSKGVIGTIQEIATEDEALGWKKLYAGFASLLTRQVIFGSIKFLAFERACESIFKLWPSLQDATWTSLLVSVVAGGISGTLSCVISQPADSVLTYVARNSESENLGVIEGSLTMVQKEGIGSLFRGIGSRIIWSGSIIAGQFLLYDVFRSLLGVSTADLSQVFEVAIFPSS